MNHMGGILNNGGYSSEMKPLKQYHVIGKSSIIIQHHTDAATSPYHHRQSSYNGVNDLTS